MEKGSIPRLNIPIPSEIPEKPDLSYLPNDVVKSGAVESLLQQNDDLMARLSVSLRRVSQLEDKLNHSRIAQEKIRFQYENLKDQVLILKEKTRAFTDRKEGSEREFRELKEQARLAEIRYTELQENTDAKIQALTERSDKLAKRVSQFLEYRRRIKKAHASMKVQHSADQQDLTQQVDFLKTDKERMVKKIETTEKTLAEVRQKLTETTGYIQNQGKTFQEERDQLTERFENRFRNEQKIHEEKIASQRSQQESTLSVLEKEIARLQLDNHKLKDRVIDYDKIYEDNIELKNRAVFADRKKSEIKDRLDEEVESLQSQLAHFRSEAKTKSVEAHELEQELTELKKLAKNTQTEKTAVDGQIENLQILWRNTQAELEKQTERNKALQKINQQLSLNLNVSRKDIKDLKQKVDMTSLQAQSEISDLKKASIAQSLLTSGKQAANPPEVSHKAMNRIDSLIAEIQSGFKSSGFR